MNIKGYRIAAALLVMPTGCGERARPDAAESTTAAMPIEGVYSDITYNDESGDASGSEVIIERSGTTYRAIIRIAEDGLGNRAVVPLTVAGQAIEFTIPPDSGVEVQGGQRRPIEIAPPRRFIGRVTSWGLRGTVESWSDSLKLPRKDKPYFSDSDTAGY